MNARARLFLNGLPGLTAVAVGSAGLLLSGCMSNPLAETAVDPRSPIAAEVTKAARLNTDYPSFSEIPAAPTDVRPLRAYGQAARDVKLAGAQLEQATAPGTWSLQNSDTFAAQARAAAGPEISPPVAGETEAFAASQRRRATPPPPPKR